MVWYSAYLDDKQEIVDMGIDQNPTLTTGDISDVDLKWADTMIWHDLNEEGIVIEYTGTDPDSEVKPADINNFLWAASLAYNLEFLSYRGLIHYQPGGIQRTRFGNVTHQFMRMQPMFFLGGGAYNNIEKVRPFRSYKQIGQQFTQAYLKAYNRKERGTNVADPVVAWDASSRGYAWNADVEDYIKAADDEFET